MTENISVSAETLPMMPLRGISVFPGMIINFDVERSISINAINCAVENDRRIFLVTQKEILKEAPLADDLYQIGTICILRQSLKTQTGGMRVMVEGVARAKTVNIEKGNDCFHAEVVALEEKPVKMASSRIEALLRQAVSLFDEYSSLTGNSVPETLVSLTLSVDPSYIADYIAQNAILKHTQKQQVLEMLDPIKRLQLINNIIGHEIEVLSIEQDINQKLHDNLMRMQRDNVLREQMRVIQSELGGDENISEIEKFKEKIYAAELPEEVENKLIKETERLAKQPFGSSEASVIRSYLELCLELPWNKTTKERVNIATARKILDNDHFGLEKVKERIIEFLAVKQLAPEIKGTILCLVGPPGVGKTSVAISIAKAVNRKLARMSLGGIHDEAEIRGHRKTYVGAMPGRIIAAVNQAGTKNPLILLDEIDKLGSDYRGDPSSALLEALDPEQNTTFRDHYLEVPFDLSDVLFITTANTTSTIPRPLLDRMEIIELTSYTDEEKLQIAKQHLLIKQREKHGLSARQLKISDDAIREIIASYTKESGVRQLERELAAICRKTAAKIAEEKIKSASIKASDIEEYLGIRKYLIDNLSLRDEVGIVKGLAWTSAGGEILEVEVNVLDGNGKLELTGNLGDVMKESARAAVSYIRSRADKLNIKHDFYNTCDIHIHFPEGAIPKDGPSAGITIAVAVISALTGAPVHRDIAMTGEITLRGRILPIGGLKEKTMAALRSGIKTVIIPAENERDLEEIDQTVRKALNFVMASHIDNILSIALDFSACPPAEKLEDILVPGMLTETNEPKSIRQ